MMGDVDSLLDRKTRRVRELEAEAEQLREALRDACDVAMWMSGSPSFGDDGEAHEGWVNVMRPKLKAALAALGETETE